MTELEMTQRRTATIEYFNDDKEIDMVLRFPFERVLHMKRTQDATPQIEVIYDTGHSFIMRFPKDASDRRDVHFKQLTDALAKYVEEHPNPRQTHVRDDDAFMIIRFDLLLTLKRVRDKTVAIEYICGYTVTVSTTTEIERDEFFEKMRLGLGSYRNVSERAVVMGVA